MVLLDTDLHQLLVIYRQLVIFRTLVTPILYSGGLFQRALCTGSLTAYGSH